MPGSYQDPRSYANIALDALEEAYEENHNAPAGDLILKAIEAIKNLRHEINNQRKPVENEYDRYEINDFNTAI
jgi:hypothetical protein